MSDIGIYLKSMVTSDLQKRLIFFLLLWLIISVSLHVPNSDSLSVMIKGLALKFITRELNSHWVPLSFSYVTYFGKLSK